MLHCQIDIWQLANDIIVPDRWWAKIYIYSIDRRASGTRLFAVLIYIVADTKDKVIENLKRMGLRKGSRNFSNCINFFQISSSIV